ncbi:sarcolemmal membrane-associated protein-like [Anopheles aquasalis]|uniref:sarcolemmal membrane-associated protein-like n=1 Tax=Anopheles aquasalis TaxID=42839 RepID=UPI00215A9E97|nr:sarcolemmal membrane-associated protein-like [Anopheles aquasalis]
MVIINNRDDFLPFLKSPGVRMQTPLVNSVTTTTASLNRDVASQQQQQQQLGNINNNNNNNNNNTLINNNNNNSIAGVVTSVVTAGSLNVNNINNNNNNINNNNNGQPQHARALLICRPNSHPFNNRTLYLEPGAQAKVGRSVARIRVSENNAIFDCKVLSRNHAVLWYKDGRFFIKDTGSSNGTFINNIRLSQTCTESEPYEISSGDIVQFGVDVMENTRRETHGCITATLKLFLPDGRETKASQKVGIGGQSAIIPPVDLYRLNQYIQEAHQREQILETKLISLQKMVETTKQNSTLGWQAMIDEDRLLSRIDMLEKKLQYCQKNLTEDKLREDLAKLLEEKHQYQNSAKETMYKLHQDRLDAVHKQISLEKALCTSEDECSLLREQLNKTKQQLQETTVCMDTLKSQYDEKVASSEEQLKAKESEITSLTHKLDHFVDVYAIASSDDEQQHQKQHQEHQQIHSSAMSNWLKNSDIKKLEGSEDIIKAICNDTETDISSNEYTSGLTKLQRRINTLEKNFTLLFGADLKAENDPLEEVESESETSECSIVTATNDNATTTTIKLDPLAVGDGDGGVEVSGNGPLDESGIDRKKECDGNQNDVKSSISSTASSIASDDSGDSDASNNTIGDMNVIQQAQNHVEQEEKEKGDGLPAPPYGATPAPTVDPQLNQNVMRRNIRLIKSECMALLRQVEKTMQQKQSEQQTQKAKYEELETELLAFKAELKSRPKLEELERKQQLCDSLTESVSTLRFEVDELRTINDRCQLEMERMELELLNHKNSENEKLSAFPVPVSADDPSITVECAAETDGAVRQNAAEEDGEQKRTAELSMMPQTLLVVTENAPVAEMPSPVTIPPSVPMVDVETQTEPCRDHVSMGSSTSDLRPVLPLDEPLDVSDGGDSSSNSCNPELDEYGDEGEDDDEKTETIDITTIYNGPTIGENPVSGATPKPTTIPPATKNGRNGAPSSLLLLASTALAASCDDASSTLRRSTLAAAPKSPEAAFDHELALINHPDVQREEELIVFKEKYAHLSEENVRLNQQLQRLSGEMNQFRYGSPFQLLMYVIPIVAIIGYLMLNRT